MEPKPDRSKERFAIAEVLPTLDEVPPAYLVEVIEEKIGHRIGRWLVESGHMRVGRSCVVSVTMCQRRDPSFTRVEVRGEVESKPGVAVPLREKRAVQLHLICGCVVEFRVPYGDITDVQRCTEHAEGGGFWEALARSALAEIAWNVR